MANGALQGKKGILQEPRTAEASGAEDMTLRSRSSVPRRCSRVDTFIGRLTAMARISTSCGIPPPFFMSSSGRAGPAAPGERQEHVPLLQNQIGPMPVIVVKENPPGLPPVATTPPVSGMSGSTAAPQHRLDAPTKCRPFRYERQSQAMTARHQGIGSSGANECARTQLTWTPLHSASSRQPLQRIALV